VNFEETLRSVVASEIAQLRADLQAFKAEVRRDIPPALVPVREAAQSLGVSESTLRRGIWRGNVPCTRIGRLARTDLAKLRPLEPAEVVQLATVARR
jgi:excisionase family DNA binding protein